MASMFRIGSSRKKAEVQGKIHIQFKKSSKGHHDSDDVEDENDEDDNGGDENLPVTFGNGVSDNLSEAVTQAEPAEETPGKKKAPTRIDTSVLDSVCCSACGRQLNPYKSGSVQKHDQLKVVICKHCSKFLSSGEISKDQDGVDEQCRWCGEGGRLLVCDDCSSAFCKSCVMRNFSRSEFSKINSQESWLCYLCNQKPLKSLQENYRKIRDTLKALQEKRKAKTAALTASPASTNSQHSKKSADTKQSASSNKSVISNSLRGDASASMTLLSSEDLNVGHENVNATIDKLTTATNTLRDVLQALRSQSLPSAAASANSEQKRKQQARALNKSLETFLKSLKTILTESDLADDDGVARNKAPAKSASSSLAPRSDSSLRPTATSGSLSKEADTKHSSNKNSDSKKSVLVQQISSESNAGSDNIIDITHRDEARPKNRDKTNSVTNMNGDVTKKKSSVISSSEPSKETKDSEIKTTRSTKNSSGSSKDRAKDDNKEDSDGSDAGEKDTSENSEKSHSKDKSKDSGRKEASQNDSRREKPEKAEDSSRKETVSEDESEDVAKIDSDASDDATEKEAAVSASKIGSMPDDENLAAKFDLIKEIADEITRDNTDLDKENGDNEGVDDTDEGVNDNDEDDDNDLPITFGADPTLKSDSETKTAKRKKASASSSDEDPIKTEKKSKRSNSLNVKKSLSEADNKKAKQDKKQKPESEVDDSSSPDPLSSGDDDTVLSTRRRIRKATGKEGKKTTEKNSKTTSPKQSAAKTAKKKSGKDKTPSEVDDIDKEIAKLSKLPTKNRKRKAADDDDDEDDAEEKESASETVKEKPTKRSKPGPKSSKKGIDYDDLSSDEHERNDDDVDEDEDELPVTFFGNAEEAEGQPDLDENEIAKKGLLEDIESENDDNEEAEADSSSDEESDKESTKKTKKEKKKKESRESEDVKNEDSTDSENNEDSDENIGKRKKLHSKLLDAKLSDSDSDIGSKKKKKDDSDADVESEKSSGSSADSDLSDEDDSDDSDDDDEDSETKSKKKGKKKGKKNKRGKGKKNDEDDDSSEEDGKKGKKGKGKTRKRIKRMSNSSDEGGGSEDDDDDDPNSSKAGKRKQIRKVMSNKRLEDSTRAAAKAEEKRRKRIEAKQREFNIETITDENNPMNCLVTTKLVLEAGKEEGDEPLVQVNKKLVRRLKPHQVEGVQFMWDCLYESVKRAKKGDGAGCILAHCMGLGKTLSVITFVHTILTHEKILKHRTCLIVSPLNTVLNWNNEWKMWFDEEDQLEVWELAGCKQNALRAKALRDWQESGGIMIIGYEMYRNLTLGNRCKNKKQKTTFQETLVDPGPDLVICDEGHILKNEASAISKAMNRMRTRRRVVLTGTPLQNNLNEYHCMLSFVKPNLLGTRKEFNNRFISPIQNGQCTDSTQGDFKLMKARAHVLHEMLAGCVQRRDYSALTKFLPPKQEYVISVRLTSIQIELYEKYLELTGQGVDGVYTNKGARLFRDYQNLMKIWTHPWVLKLAEIRDELKGKYDDDESSFIDDEDTEEESLSGPSSSSSSDDDKAGSGSGEEGTSSKKPKTQGGTRRTRAKARRDAGEDSDPEEVVAEWKSKSEKKGVDSDGEEQDKTLTRDWWAAYVTEDDKLKLELSNKLYLLFEILRMCEEIGDKVLIFSQSILSLNIIESFLEVIDAKFQQECEHLSEEEREKEGIFGRSWTKNLDYYRMDGSTSAQQRHNWASSFNDIDNYRARLFLISTRAGGLGINLVAANRVIIFDASWNPSHDVQSIFRVYRFGQTKPCYIYRFLAQGTMEEKIYERQVTKLSLSQRVVDEHQIERHFSANDLKELYNFRPDRWDDGTEKPTLSLPKDPLLAEILTNNKQCVVSFHEHDSLLENQVEQTLTEEEKKAAWEEYENEKKGVIKGPGMDGRTSSWPMMAAAQLLSREQIAATVQALRQQLPDVAENLFQLHLQQALRRQVQIKQEELRKMELMRLQELNYINMMKQQNPNSALRAQMMQNMTPWLQQMRAMQQNAMFMGGGSSSSHMGVNQSAAGMNRPGQSANNPISNKPEEAIDLDDN